MFEIRELSRIDSKGLHDPLRQEMQSQMLEFNFFLQKNNISYPPKRAYSCCEGECRSHDVTDGTR